MQVNDRGIDGSISWVHLSDFHFKAGPDYGRDEVLLALREDLAMFAGRAEPERGYVVWPDRIRVRGETVRRFRRRIRRRLADSGGAVTPEARLSLAAWRGHVGLAGGFRRIGGLR